MRIDLSFFLLLDFQILLARFFTSRRSRSFLSTARDRDDGRAAVARNVDGLDARIALAWEKRMQGDRGDVSHARARAYRCGNGTSTCDFCSSIGAGKVARTGNNFHHNTCSKRGKSLMRARARVLCSLFFCTDADRSLSFDRTSFRNNIPDGTGPSFLFVRSSTPSSPSVGTAKRLSSKFTRDDIRSVVRDHSPQCGIAAYIDERRTTKATKKISTL